VPSLLYYASGTAKGHEKQRAKETAERKAKIRKKGKGEKRRRENQCNWFD
jgi:hypothetical protein